MTMVSISASHWPNSLPSPLVSQARLPLILVSRWRLSRVWPARLLPAFLLFLSLPSFHLILPLHSPLTRGTTNRNGVSSSTVTATSLPDANPSNLNTPKRRSAWPPAYVSTEQQLHVFNYNRGSASGRGPTGGGRHWRLQKNDRDRITFTTDNGLRVHSFRVVDSRQSLDANQSN